MIYELVSTSVTIAGKVFRKKEKVKLNSEKMDKVLLDSAYESGFIKPVNTKAKTPEEVKLQYKSEKAEAIKKAAEAAAKKAETEAAEAAAKKAETEAAEAAAKKAETEAAEAASKKEHKTTK